MARKHRIHYPGAVYHVMLRGNAKQPIFHGNESYRRFEDVLAQGMDQYELVLYAYCWMKNHVHMVLQVEEQPLSKLMQNISQRYTHWFNKQNDRVGHLFQGRYKAILIQEDRYMRELIRYVHLNPVRAQMVKAVDQYSFSSHRAYAGQVKAPKWLAIDMGMSYFGVGRSGARTSYLDFIGQRTDTKLLEQLRCGSSKEKRVLGSDDFIKDVLRRNDEAVPANITLQGLLDIVAGVYDILPQEIISASRQRQVSEARAMAAMAGVDYCGFSLTDLARYVDRDISALGRQVKTARARVKKYQSLQKKMNMIASQITTKTHA